jgi:BolA family transcriptional regulator, general stress-responsive regulator
VNLVQTIQQRLAVLEPRSLELVDDSAKHIGHEGASRGGKHFSLTIVSDRFAGMSTVQRHRQIYEALGPLMHREIHALAIRALTPDEL